MLKALGVMHMYFKCCEPVSAHILIRIFALIFSFEPDMYFAHILCVICHVLVIALEYFLFYVLKKNGILYFVSDFFFHLSKYLQCKVVQGRQQLLYSNHLTIIILYAIL